VAIASTGDELADADAPVGSLVMLHTLTLGLCCTGTLLLPMY
jgi:hypothetical protein